MNCSSYSCSGLGFDSTYQQLQTISSFTNFFSRPLESLSAHEGSDSWSGAVELFLIKGTVDKVCHSFTGNRGVSSRLISRRTVDREKQLPETL